MTFACARRLACALPALLCTAACQPRNGGPSASGDDVAVFVGLVMPRKIEIQRYLTRAVSFEGSGNPDGVEVILAARDALDDAVKAAGTFHFELNAARGASGDRIGDRVALWTIAIDSESSMAAYWDRLARYHHFPLRIEGGTLAPGKYVLTVQFNAPGGGRLFDQYEFTLEPGPVPLGR